LPGNTGYCRFYESLVL